MYNQCECGNMNFDTGGNCNKCGKYYKPLISRTINGIIYPVIQSPTYTLSTGETTTSEADYLFDKLGYRLVANKDEHHLYTFGNYEQDDNYPNTTSYNSKEVVFRNDGMYETSDYLYPLYITPELHKAISVKLEELV